MNNFIKNSMNELNLEYTPHTKAMLEIYTEGSDEELVITNKFLKSELLRLFQTSNLSELIIFEYMRSSDYDGNTEVSLEDVNLNYTPHTKHLLKEYMSNQYQESMELTNENLKQELLKLHEFNALDALFISEWIYSPGGLEPETNFKSQVFYVEIQSLKDQLRRELQILNKFLSLQACCFNTDHTEFRESCKSFQYLNYDENKNKVIFSDEPLTPINVASAGKLKETFWNLADRIDNLEQDISELIIQLLNNIGINLPPDFRFSTSLD